MRQRTRPSQEAVSATGLDIAGKETALARATLCDDTLSWLYRRNGR